MIHFNKLNTLQGVTAAGPSSRNLYKKRKAAGKLRDAKDFADKIHVSQSFEIHLARFQKLFIFMKFGPQDGIWTSEQNPLIDTLTF